MIAVCLFIEGTLNLNFQRADCDELIVFVVCLSVRFCCSGFHDPKCSQLLCAWFGYCVTYLFGMVGLAECVLVMSALVFVCLVCSAFEVPVDRGLV